MDIQNTLKILSDVLGFDCSSFEEVVDNGILRSLSSSLEYAKDIAKKLNALAELLGHENTYKVYKNNLLFKGQVFYTVMNDTELKTELKSEFAKCYGYELIA